MKKSISIIGLSILIMLLSFLPKDSKVVTTTGHISMFSHTVAEDITANNYKVTSTLDLKTGEIVFSVPMQGFEFKKALMQKHYNSPKFLDTKQFPKSKFKGAIINMNEIDLMKDGKYDVSVKGDLTLHGVTKTIEEKGTVVVKGEKVDATSKLNIILADYNIEFVKGKPSTNVAKEVEVTLVMNYKAR